MGRPRKPDPDPAAAAADLLAYEEAARAEGWRRIAGVDEAGRGPLAGPVVAAAVILPATGAIPAVRDSKQLSPRRRAELAAELLALPGLTWGLAWIEPGRIDRDNILRATHAAMREALLKLDPPADFALVDGLPVPGLPAPSRAIVKGDTLSASIAAASILAKVHRDRYMEELDRCYPGYGFTRHKGYGTAEHLDAIRRLGPCPEHRLSFAPVRAAAAGASHQLELSLYNPR